MSRLVRKSAAGKLQHELIHNAVWNCQVIMARFVLSESIRVQASFGARIETIRFDNHSE